MKYKFIAIEGNIGSGKTTLANLLSVALDTELILEEFAENTFLEKFYQSPEHYAFPLEVSFLVERFNQIQLRFTEKEILKKGVISDYFFNKSLLFAQMNLNKEQYHLFHQIYTVLIKQIPPPDVLLFLENNTTRLQQNIKKRGRTFEQSIKNEYLQTLSDAYKNYFKITTDKVIYIDISEIDFVVNETYLDKIIALLTEDWQPGLNVVKIE